MCAGAVQNARYIWTGDPHDSDRSPGVRVRRQQCIRPPQMEHVSLPFPSAAGPFLSQYFKWISGGRILCIGVIEVGSRIS